MKTADVLNTIEKYNMLPDYSRVVVGVSGGSDSMCLLNILCELRNKKHLTLEAAHVNHGIRGREADDDEAFVEEQCRKLNVPLHKLSVNIPEIVKESGESPEEAGRRIRYEFFSSLTEDGFIATAHNLSDREETFIFNFARGTSLKGLCSIPPVRGKIIRPLIDCTKNEIEEYCRENNIPFVTDKTNSDVNYARNRIRHNVVTELKKINPGFEECALRCIEYINEDEEYLHGTALNAFEKSQVSGGYDSFKLSELPLPVLRRVLTMICDKELGIKPDGFKLRRLCEMLEDYSGRGIGSEIQLGDNAFVRVRNGRLEIPKEAPAGENEITLRTGDNIFGDFLIKVENISNVTDYSQSISEKSSIHILDSDKICGSLRARVRTEGDRINVFPRNVTKALRRLQNENGIEPEIRQTAPVIADNEGVAASFRCGTDSRVAARKNTKNKIKLTIILTGD